MMWQELLARPSCKGVDKPAKYFKDLDPTCIALDASFVSKSTLEQLDAAVDEALKNEGWCEAGLFLPLTLYTSPPLFISC